MVPLLPLLLAAAAGVPLQAPSESIPAAARAAIEAANSEWVPAMQHRAAAAIARAYSDDGVFVSPNGGVAKGRQAIEQLMRDRFQSMGAVVGGSIKQDGLTRQGTLIYEWGHAALEVAGTGGVARTTGRYLTVWQASTDGRWRIIRNLSLPE